MSTTESSLKPPTFDTLAFLDENWRSVKALSEFFAIYGVDARVPAIIKWRERGRVPSDKFALMLAFLELEHGKPYSLTPFIK